MQRARRRASGVVGRASWAYSQYRLVVLWKLKYSYLVSVWLFLSWCTSTLYLVDKQRCVRLLVCNTKKGEEAEREIESRKKDLFLFAHEVAAVRFSTCWRMCVQIVSLMLYWLQPSFWSSMLVSLFHATAGSDCSLYGPPCLSNLFATTPDGYNYECEFSIMVQIFPRIKPLDVLLRLVPQILKYSEHSAMQAKLREISIEFFQFSLVQFSFLI